MDEFIERLSNAGPIAPEQVRVDPQRGLWVGVADLRHDVARRCSRFEEERDECVAQSVWRNSRRQCGKPRRLARLDSWWAKSDGGGSRGTMPRNGIYFST